MGARESSSCLRTAERRLGRVSDRYTPVCMLTKHDHTLKTAASRRPVTKQCRISMPSVQDVVTSWSRCRRARAGREDLDLEEPSAPLERRFSVDILLGSPSL